MFVTDLEGNEYPIQATTTNEAELNGNQSISLIIEANKVNNLFIDNLERMWQITDHDDITYIIIYCIRKGKGDKLTINVKGIPLFFDKLDTMRTYEEYNQSMTASVFFNLVFKDTGFFPVLVDPFYSVEWEGLGKGETQLSMFKKGLNRYKAEFEIKGNDIHLRTKVGRDTSFMYRYKLNASNIVEENDASALYTYAKGFGNFAEDDEANAKLIREYTSPLSSLIGIRHAPPIYDGRMTIASELDNRLKELVEESLKVSVSADIHDLSKQNYLIAQSELGDRVFLIDERINLHAEVRVVQQSKVRDWKGNILGLNVTFGSPNIYKRYQSNLQSSIDRITDLLDSTQPIPYNVLPPAIKVVTDALKSALTELEFTNGIIARDKMNPNYLVLFNSNGIGISRDGGSTFKEAITSEGFVLSAGAIGKLSANNIQIGAETTFETGYDPSQVKIELTNDLESIQDQIATLGGEIDESFRDGIIEEAEAIAIETQINLLNSENRSLERRYLNIYHNDFLASGVPKTALGAAKIDFDVKHADLINSITVSISDRKISDVEKTDFNKKFEAYTTALATLVDKLEICSDQITTRTANMAELNAKKYAEELKEVLDIDIEDMQDQISTLGGKIDESFRDGIIDEAEANAIELYINSLNAERENIDNRYTAIYDNVNLSGIPKNDLFTKKNTFNLAHTKLINSIDDALRDGKATDAEKTDIDEKFASYSSTLADLATSFEKAIDAISLKRATDATNSVREDLRLAAPLPTSLTLDQSGIRASTNNSNQYAQLDYRGLYIKQGAVQIERPDGYSIINNGILQHDFSINGATPPFTANNVSINGYYWETTSHTFTDCQFYSFKHDCRYLCVGVQVHTADSPSGAVYAVQGLGGATLAQKIVYNTKAEAPENGETLIIDLGVPTGNVIGVYSRLRTGAPGGYRARARVIRMWKEG